MEDRPIIFSGPMVRALLDGRKTMTRRLAWRIARNAGEALRTEVVLQTYHDDEGVWTVSAFLPTIWQKVKPGDRLYVREAFKLVGGDPGAPIYRANWREDSRARGFDNVPDADPGGWKPSIHMPRWASRLTLVVTATKIERLQAISEEDAKAEGMQPACGEGCCWYGPKGETLHFGPRDAFATLWNFLHGPDAWRRNPEVVALTFTVMMDAA